MTIPHAILLVRAVCNRRHLSFSTEKTYTHWVGRYGLFLKGRAWLPRAKPATVATIRQLLALVPQRLDLALGGRIGDGQAGDFAVRVPEPGRPRSAA